MEVNEIGVPINTKSNIISDIIAAIKSIKLNLSDEKQLQENIAKIFNEKEILYSREYHLSNSDIPDFFIDGVCVEIKIKGNAKSIYRQCVRYCEHEKVQSLILITGRTIGFPPAINNKPCYVVKISESWL